MFRRLALLPALALLASCDTGGPTTVVAFDGSLVFTYSGAQSGTFNASGTVPTNAAEQTTNPWAAAVASATSEMTIAAAAPRSASTHDYVSIFIQRNTVGSETINSSCGFNCNAVDIQIGASNTASGFTASCYLLNGTIAITEKSATRMKGTFSGTGPCMSSTGSSQGALTVASGTFDVPIVSEVP